MRPHFRGRILTELPEVGKVWGHEWEANPEKRGL